MSAADLLKELGFRENLQLQVSARLPAQELAELDRVAASAGVTRARMAQAFLRDGLRRYSPAS